MERGAKTRWRSCSDVKSEGCEEKKMIDKVEQLTTEHSLANSHLGKEADIIRMNFTRMI